MRNTGLHHFIIGLFLLCIGIIPPVYMYKNLPFSGIIIYIIECIYMIIFIEVLRNIHQIIGRIKQFLNKNHTR